MPENIEDTKDIIEQIRSKFEVTICSWTGFDVEDWWRKDEYDAQKNYHLLDYVVDGRFIYRPKTKTKCLAVSINALNTKKLLN